MVKRALAFVCGSLLLAGCHLVLGYEGSYEERESTEAAQAASTGGCVCEPGQEQACAKCGKQTCTGDCVWSACEGQGVCDPGAEEPCGGGCGVRVCSLSCTWCGCPADSCADCQGMMGGWLGCRGNGCSVCAEKVEVYPCYFQNHPECAPNVGCKDDYFECSTKCPPPTAADACMCPPIGGMGFWSGCKGSGCEVCADVVTDYACYFVHNPLCVGPETCDETSLCNSGLCPPPTDVDKGSMQ